MGFHGGGETTLEDEIIYDHYFMLMINDAEDKLRDPETWKPVGVAPDRLRMTLETLVYNVVKWERGL